MTEAAVQDVSEMETDTAGEELREEILRDFLATYKSKHAAERKDVLEGHFVIHLNQPLPEFNTGFAKAYKATDELELDRPLFALVCTPHLPPRVKLLRILKNNSHSNLITLVTVGIADLSAPQEQRLVLVYDKPRGKTLSAISAEQPKPLPDNFIIERIILPLASVIHSLGVQHTSHGRVHPDNVIFGEHAVLGECAAEPCGHGQSFFYEPLGRIQAHVSGKGEGTVAHDYFALGVMVAWLKYGNSIFKNMTQEEYTDRVTNIGSYLTLLGNREISDHMNDFLRGCLNDTIHERWSYDQIRQWAGGRRYNTMLPSMSMTGARSFNFEGEHNHFRSLAHALWKHWDLAPSVLRDGAMIRWIDLSARRKDVAEQVGKAAKSIGGESSRNERLNSELISRCLTILDPAGPLRLKEVCVNPDGVGALLADYVRQNAEHSLQHVADIIEHGLPTVWSDIHRRQREEHIPPDASTAVWNLERARMTVRMSGYGFGIERVLYDLNPELACQSPLLHGYYATNLTQLLNALDQLAPAKARTEVPFDRHIAAFIYSKLGMFRELHMPEFNKFPSMARDKGMLALKFLQQAQEKVSHPKLPGLSAWISASIAPAVSALHSKSLRKQVQNGLHELAYGGYLTPIADFVCDKEYLVADQSGFDDAVGDYHSMSTQISDMQNESRRYFSAMELGHSIAKMIAYMVFMGVLFIVVKQHT